MRISVLISSYGGRRWHRMATSRAEPSASTQGAHEVLVLHEQHGTIASCRNNNAAQATGEWLCFLDADDEMTAGYIGAIQAAENPELGDLALYTPMVEYVQGRRRQEPKFWPESDLTTGNWMVIGTVVSKRLFTEIGGFHEGDPHGLEDWALWAMAYQRGAKPVKVPGAIYIAHQHDLSSHARFMRDRNAYMTAYRQVRERLWA